MRTVEQKLSSLTPDSVWYFAKQDTDFDKSFKAVQIFDQIPDRANTNIGDYFAANADRFNFHSNHRILSVAQLFGLLSKAAPFEKRGTYNTESPTPVFYALNRYQPGSKEYNAIKTEQMLKLRMSAITDSRVIAGSYKVNPILYVFEVFWRLSLKGITSISLNQFYTYVMTCKSHDEIDETVELLSQNPTSSQYVDTYKGNSRVLNLIVNNFNLIKLDGDTICINQDYWDYYKNFFHGPYSAIIKMFDLMLDDTTVYQSVLTNHIGLDFNFIDSPSVSTPAIIPPTNPQQNNIEEVMKNYIEALKTKPFLLLAGISGTGKSQKVKELAYMTCPQSALGSTPTTPGNYCLIEVKPNWHDSSELLGYYSSLTGKYHVTDFLRFVHKAATNKSLPFFVCLDEMNLAPVEQYFAEYLSVLETRTVVDGKIQSAMLLTKESFEGYDLNKDYTETDRDVVKFIQQNGLSLPENLFIIGTVNMDDTTHQFSRKVIDRAFTIEMNGGELEAMFSDENTNALKYRENPVSLEVFKPKYVKASEALEDSVVGKYADTIKISVPSILTKVNEILKDTPFRVSYRVQNELILYVANMILTSSESSIDVDAIIKESALVILLEKILPRVQGDDKLLSDAAGSVFSKLKTLLETNFSELSESAVFTEVVTKLDEMDKRLTNTYFANFF